MRRSTLFDGGVVEAPFETNGAKRGISVCYPYAEADLMAQFTPVASQPANRFAHFECHHHCLECWLFDWHWIVEHDHDAIASVALQGAAVLDDDLTDGRMVVAQQSHHVFRVGAFRKAREPAQVAEQL